MRSDANSSDLAAAARVIGTTCNNAVIAITPLETVKILHAEV